MHTVVVCIVRGRTVENVQNRGFNGQKWILSMPVRADLI